MKHDLTRRRKELEDYFNNQFTRILEGINHINTHKIEKAKSINFYYKVESIQQQIKVTTMYFFIYKKHPRIKWDIVCLFDNNVKKNCRSCASQLLSKQIEKKLSELHDLYNFSNWLGNSLLISKELDGPVQISFDNDGIEALFRYPTWKLYNNVHQIEEEINALKEELKRLNAIPEINPLKAKKLIKKYIEQENKSKPLKDAALKMLLETEEKGYFIMRRDIARYRQELGVNVARLRKIKPMK